MILASRNFRDMLGNDNFEEGQTLRTQGAVEVPLPEDDPGAFILLLHIIHATTRKVPRHVCLSTLTALAILVDKYSLLEAVELFSDLWIDNVKDEEPMPESFTDDVPSWLMISWVFQKPVEFKAMSRIIEQECDERLEDMFGDDLPVFPFIIGRSFYFVHGQSNLTNFGLETLKSYREKAIESAINVMHDLITKYSNPDKLLCPHQNENTRFSCDALVLGALLKGCISIRIWPKPAAPYPGLIFKNLVSQIRGLKLPDICTGITGRRNPIYECHGNRAFIEKEMEALENGMCGLDLEDFLPKKTA
jgi:hypothetical protein